jgi:hypothetical protein
MNVMRQEATADTCSLSQANRRECKGEELEEEEDAVVNSWMRVFRGFLHFSSVGFPIRQK